MTTNRVLTVTTFQPSKSQSPNEFNNSQRSLERKQQSHMTWITKNLHRNLNNNSFIGSSTGFKNVKVQL